MALDLFEAVYANTYAKLEECYNWRQKKWKMINDGMIWDERAKLVKTGCRETGG
jgi:hypothetical protein